MSMIVWMLQDPLDKDPTETEVEDETIGTKEERSYYVLVP